MPNASDVLQLITDWSGQRPGKMSQVLEDWWNQTTGHSALKFDPDGIDDLLNRIRTTFSGSPQPSEGDFRGGGNIKTVQDLLEALQQVASDEPMTPPRKKKAAAKKKTGTHKKKT